MELSDSLNIDIEINSDDNFTCSICMEEIDIENKCITNCNHEFCKKCSFFSHCEKDKNGIIVNR